METTINGRAAEPIAGQVDNKVGAFERHHVHHPARADGHDRGVRSRFARRRHVDA